jgi:hypothetical protein
LITQKEDSQTTRTNSESKLSEKIITSNLNIFLLIFYILFTKCI